MNAQFRCANAFVLSYTDYRDRDLIIRAAVEDHGLCALIAKSARGSRRRYGGALDVLTPSALTFRPSENGLGQVREAHRLAGPEPSSSDLAAYGVRCYAAEFLLATVEENHPTRYPFRLMRWVHDALSEPLEQGQAKMKALWVLNRIRVIGLHREGRLPDLHRCSECQGEFRVEGALEFTRDRGILCENCAVPTGERFSMRFGHLMELREFYAGGLFPAEWSSQELSHWLEEQVREVLGKSLGSLRVLNGLKAPE